MSRSASEVAFAVFARLSHAALRVFLTFVLPKCRRVNEPFSCAKIRLRRIEWRWDNAILVACKMIMFEVAHYEF
jgi:hypothetical protein